MRSLPLAPPHTPSTERSDPTTRTTTPRRAVLLGPVQQENLALQYLAAAARAAGHEVHVLAYSYRADLDDALTQTLALQPDLVGLGIAFQNNIDDYVELMRMLRARGYAGHLTCGGHVPTFCHAELLADVPGLDSVVRHDGEETLVELLDALGAGRAPAGIAGLVTRGEGGALVQGPVRQARGDLDALPWPERSEESYSVGGLKVDFIIAARGCVGECNYCSIAAYTTEQRKRYRLRRADAVAEEVAALHHRRGARVIFVQDDLFVLPSEKKTVERTEGISEGLRQRDVGELVFWAKGRPESITPGVAQALQRMGVIHVFLGVESASAARLRYLGRTHAPQDNHDAIDNLRAVGIVPSFNFMLFDPDSAIEDMGETLDMAERNLDLPWNVCRTEIYSGTSLRNRLEAEGRLLGDYRSYGYRMLDPRAEVLFRIIRVSLHERALEIESLLNRLISLSFARQLHARFFPGERTDALSRRAHQLGVEARHDTVAVLREAMAFVQAEDVTDARAVQRFAVDQALRVNAQDHERRRAVEELWQHYTLRGETLMRRLGGAPAPDARSSFTVASGS